MTTENIKNTMVTVEAMKMGAKEMKQQYKKLNIDKVDVGDDTVPFCLILIYCRKYKMKWRI